MKYKHIVWTFVCILPFSVAVRFFQLFRLTEPETGFFVSEQRNTGIVLSVLIFAAILVYCVIAGFVNRCPLKTPRVTPLLGISAVTAGVFTLIESVNYVTQVNLFFWEKCLLGLLGPAAAVFLVMYGIKGFHNYKLYRPLYAIPSFYYIARLVCEFISVSKTAVIFQNLLNMCAIAAVLVFMLEWGKAANNINVERGYKRLLVSAGAAVLFCETAALPEFFLMIFNKSASEHQSMASLVSLAIIGVFVSVYIFHHFKNSNLSKKRTNKPPKTLKGSDGASYYVGDLMRRP